MTFTDFLRALCIGVVCAISLTACRPQAVNHDLDLGGVGHSTLLPRGVEKCENCHGQELRGKRFRDMTGQITSSDSCYDCHGNLWNLVDHQLSLGDIRHLSFSGEASQTCSSCHGSDLKGDGVLAEFLRPSCYSCHTNLWDFEVNHKELLGAENIRHKPGFDQALTACTDCHGANLQGGTAGSCYSCHTTTADHTAFYGTTQTPHIAGFVNATSACSACHGPELRGGLGGSCYQCHGQADHTRVESEHSVSSRHMVGLDSPLTNCVACHGTDLTGGWGNSCFQCHGNEWDEEHGSDD